MSQTRDQNSNSMERAVMSQGSQQPSPNCENKLACRKGHQQVANRVQPKVGRKTPCRTTDQNINSMKISGISRFSQKTSPTCENRFACGKGRKIVAEKIITKKAMEKVGLTRDQRNNSANTSGISSMKTAGSFQDSQETSPNCGDKSAYGKKHQQVAETVQRRIEIEKIDQTRDGNNNSMEQADISQYPQESPPSCDDEPGCGKILKQVATNILLEVGRIIMCRTRDQINHSMKETCPAQDLQEPVPDCRDQLAGEEEHQQVDKKIQMEIGRELTDQTKDQINNSMETADVSQESQEPSLDCESNTSCEKVLQQVSKKIQIAIERERINETEGQNNTLIKTAGTSQESEEPSTNCENKLACKEGHRKVAEKAQLKAERRTICPRRVHHNNSIKAAGISQDSQVPSPNCINKLACVKGHQNVAEKLQLKMKGKMMCRTKDQNNSLITKVADRSESGYSSIELANTVLGSTIRGYKLTQKDISGPTFHSTPKSSHVKTRSTQQLSSSETPDDRVRKVEEQYGSGPSTSAESTTTVSDSITRADEPTQNKGLSPSRLERRTTITTAAPMRTADTFLGQQFASLTGTVEYAKKMFVNFGSWSCFPAECVNSINTTDQVVRNTRTEVVTSQPTKSTGVTKKRPLRVEILNDGYGSSSKKHVFLQSGRKSTQMIEQTDRVQSDTAEVPVSSGNFFLWTVFFGVDMELHGLGEQKGQDDVTFDGFGVRFPAPDCEPAPKLYRVSLNEDDKTRGRYEVCVSDPADLAELENGSDERFGRLYNLMRCKLNGDGLIHDSQSIYLHGNTCMVALRQSDSVVLETDASSDFATTLSVHDGTTYLLN